MACFSDIPILVKSSEACDLIRGELRSGRNSDHTGRVFKFYFESVKVFCGSTPEALSSHSFMPTNSKHNCNLDS